MIKFSLIIPVYNKEKYIVNTLKSFIENHDIPDSEVECICVNESSTDNSGKICEEYAKRYSYIKCYNILNDGVHRPNNARNFGKKIAKGKYIMFLDADDLFCKEFLSKSLLFLETHKEYDFYLCNRYIDDIFYMHYTEHYFIYGPTLSCCIFRKHILKFIDFENEINEDILFTKKVLMNNYTFYYDESNPASYNYNVHSRQTSNIDCENVSQYAEWYFSTIKCLQYSSKYDYCLDDNNNMIEKCNKKINNIEVYAIDYCNLNCAYCANFSTLYDKKSPRDIDDIVNELKNLVRLKDDIRTITILGGEPMLHPNIGEIFTLARKMFPNNEIRMITNGTLYKRLYELKDSIIKNHIIVSVSIYPVSNTNTIQSEFKHNIPGDLLIFNTMPTDFGFYCKHLMKDYHNEYDKIYHCIVRNNCTRLSGNRLYLCEYAANLQLLKNFYKNKNIELTEEGTYIELNNDITVDDIVKFCYNAVPDLCHHCANVLQENPDINFKIWDSIPWRKTTKDISEFYQE